MNEQLAAIEKRIIEARLQLAYLSGQRDLLVSLVNSGPEKPCSSITGTLELKEEAAEKEK